MRTITVSEACNYDIDEKIPALRGKLVRVNKYNLVGKGTCQNLEIADEADPRAKIRLKIWDGQEVPSSWANQTVYIESAEAQRGGFKGVKMTQDTYEWKQGDPVKKLIEVREKDGASMVLAPNGPQSAPAARESAPNRQNPAPAQRPPPASAPERGAPPQESGQRQNGSQGQPARENPPQNDPPPPDDSGYLQEPTSTRPTRTPKTPAEVKAEQNERNEKAVRNAKHWMARRLNGLRMIFRAVDKFADERREQDKPMSPEAMQALCSSAMIDAHRVSLFNGFPTSKEEFEKIFPPDHSDNK